MTPKVAIEWPFQKFPSTFSWLNGRGSSCDCKKNHKMYHFHINRNKCQKRYLLLNRAIYMYLKVVFHILSPFCCNMHATCIHCRLFYIDIVKLLDYCHVFGLFFFWGGVGFFSRKLTNWPIIFTIYFLLILINHHIYY